MKKNLIILIIVVVIVAGFMIYNELREDQETVGGLHACWWIYKTNGDYSDLHAIQLSDRGRIVRMPDLVPYRLDDSYFGYFYACVFHSNLAFVNVSISEFKAAEEAGKNKYWECWELMEPFAKNIIEEKCNETNFDKFDPEEYPPGLIGAITGEGEYIGSNNLNIRYINKEGNKDFCGAILSSEELNEFKNIEDSVLSCVNAIPRAIIFDNLEDPEYLLNNIVDDDPFTEFYLCGVSLEERVYFEELNDIINNNELDTRCEKIK